VEVYEILDSSVFSVVKFYIIKIFEGGPIMINRMSKSVLIALALFVALSSGITFAESLNPEGVNPHANAPRKRITLKQKEAAAKARKEKQKEINARKAAQTGQRDKASQGSLSSGTVNETVNK
jgi:hypothetical protein